MVQGWINNVYYSKLLDSVLLNLVLYDLVSNDMLAIKLRSLSICARYHILFSYAVYIAYSHIHYMYVELGK